MKLSVCQILIFTFCLSALFTFPAIGQTVTGSLVGHVEDATGAVAAGARVVITETGRGTTREVVSNEEGNYSFNSLDPGTYRVEIEQANFKKFLQDNVQVVINTTVRVDGNLKAGAISETVAIESEQAQLKTDRADVSTQITSEQVEELPLSPDRNYQSVLDISPGVTESAAVGSSFGNPNGSLINRVNGQNERNNNFQLDGTINNQTNVIAPTAFIIHTFDDKSVSVRNSLLFYNALLDQNVSASLRIFPRGGHNIAVRSNPGSTAEWTNLCEMWLVETNIIR